MSKKDPPEGIYDLYKTTEEHNFFYCQSVSLFTQACIRAGRFLGFCPSFDMQFNRRNQHTYSLAHHNTIDGIFVTGELVFHRSASRLVAVNETVTACCIYCNTQKRTSALCRLLRFDIILTAWSCSIQSARMSENFFRMLR